MRGAVFTASVSLPGASAEDVESSIVLPLEEALAQVAGVRSLRSTAQTGSGTVVVELEPGRDLHAALADARSRLADIQRRLPSDAQVPLLSRIDPDAPAALWLALSSPVLPRSELSALSHQLVEPRLESLAGVSRLQRLGHDDLALVIQLDPARLDMFGLSLSDLLAVLRRLDAYASRSLADPAALARVVLGQHRGAVARLSDVASIELGAATATSAPGPAPPAPALGVFVQQGGSAAEVVQRVRAAVADLGPKLPKDVTLAEIAEPAEVAAHRAPRAVAGGDPPLCLVVRGPDWRMLLGHAAALERELRTSGTAASVTTDLGVPLASALAPAPEIAITMDRARAAELAVATSDLADVLRALMGDPVNEVAGASPDVRLPVILRVGDTQAPIDQRIAQIRVRSRTGTYVPLDALVSISARSPDAPILRRDRQRAISIVVTVALGRSPDAARQRAMDFARQLPAGYAIGEAR